MNSLAKTLVILVVACAVGFGLYQARRASQAKTEANNLRAAQEQKRGELGDRVQALERELIAATNSQGAASTALPPGSDKVGSETLRLRGEVGRLRQENASIAATNAVSKVTANPEARKMLRNQQKMAMSAVYKGFAQSMALNPEQTERLNDILADHIMNNVDQVTSVLRDKPGEAEMNRIFAAEELRLQESVREVLGDEGLARFQDIQPVFWERLRLCSSKACFPVTKSKGNQKRTN